MLQDIMSQTIEQLSGFVPSLFGAVGILVVGWIVALAARTKVRGTLRRTHFDERVAAWTIGRPVSLEQPAGTVVFWIIMLFVAMAVFQVLDLPMVAQPLNALLGQLANFLPQLGGAVIVLLAAWIVATVVRRLVARGLHAIKLDDRLASGDDAEESGPKLADSLAEGIYWLVFLLFLPAVLGALSLEGLLEPVQSLVDELLGFLPNILGAILVLGVGWFAANLVRRIVVNLLSAVGIDRLAGRVGVERALGTVQLSGVIGLVVYILILLPVLISALDTLALEAVTGPASNMLASMLEAVPALFGAMFLVALTYVIGQVVAELVTNVIAAAGFDNILVRLGLVEGLTSSPRPSVLVGRLILVFLMLFASVEAAGMLGFEALEDLLVRFLVLAGQVVLGLIIFGIGLFVANIADHAVRANATRQASLLAWASRVSIIVLASAIGLSQMGLADEIISLAFGLLLGAIAIAVALAFGLGARDAAGREVDNWIKRIRHE